MMSIGVLADTDRLDEKVCKSHPFKCVTRPFNPKAKPEEKRERERVIRNHFKEWGDEQSLHRLNQKTCGVAIYQVAEFNGKSSVEGGLGYLAHKHQHHHLFDGVLNVPVDQHKLKTPEITDYTAILESYLDNHFCDEAHLYINLPNAREFKEVGEQITEAGKQAAKTKDGSKAEKAAAKEAAEKDETKTAVQARFHDSMIYQNAVPAVLRNIRIKKLTVHRVVGFTHAAFEAKNPKLAIDKTMLYNEDLTAIFEKVHIMDPVEFDLDEYRKDMKIQICDNEPTHPVCTDFKNSEWHPVEIKGQNLPFRTKGLVQFVDKMYSSLAEEYQKAVQSPSAGNGAESFKAIWSESQKKSKGAAYMKVVQAGSSMDQDLTHVATQEEWPSVVRSVATHVRAGIQTEDSASTYEKYIVGSDVSRLLPLLALGIPFLMYR